MFIKLVIIISLTLTAAFAQVADSLKIDSLKIEKLYETEALIKKQTDQQKLDSLIKSQLKSEIELAVNDTRKKRRTGKKASDDCDKRFDQRC